jgi:hypothetical protein
MNNIPLRYRRRNFISDNEYAAHLRALKTTSIIESQYYGQTIFYKLEKDGQLIGLDDDNHGTTDFLVHPMSVLNDQKVLYDPPLESSGQIIFLFKLDIRGDTSKWKNSFNGSLIFQKWQQCTEEEKNYASVSTLLVCRLSPLDQTSKPTFFPLYSCSLPTLIEDEVEKGLTADRKLK